VNHPLRTEGDKDADEEEKTLAASQAAGAEEDVFHRDMDAPLCGFVPARDDV
jgi:hypothetical protein